MRATGAKLTRPRALRRRRLDASPRLASPRAERRSDRELGRAGGWWTTGGQRASGQRAPPVSVEAHLLHCIDRSPRAEEAETTHALHGARTRMHRPYTRPSRREQPSVASSLSSFFLSENYGKNVVFGGRRRMRNKRTGHQCLL